MALVEGPAVAASPGGEAPDTEPRPEGRPVLLSQGGLGLQGPG